MASSALAWSFTSRNEDAGLTGIVTLDNNGGKVRFGINSIAFPDAVLDGFYSMPQAPALAYAENIFVTNFWNPIQGYNQASQLIASKVADLAFNAGVGEGVTLLQRGANAVWTAMPALATDGVCGALTVARVNMIVGEQEEELYEAVLAQGEAFYEELCARKPTEFTPALEAEWIRRLDLRPPVG
jgi:lysozyme family protein